MVDGGDLESFGNSGGCLITLGLQKLWGILLYQLL